MYHDTSPFMMVGFGLADEKARFLLIIDFNIDYKHGFKCLQLLHRSARI